MEYKSEYGLFSKVPGYVSMVNYFYPVNENCRNLEQNSIQNIKNLGSRRRKKLATLIFAGAFATVGLVSYFSENPSSNNSENYKISYELKN